MPFTLDPEALADAAREEDEQFRPPSFGGFSDLVFAYSENRQQLIEDDTLARVYVDALLDLHALVDEYRFEALLAVALLSDYRRKLDHGEAKPLRLSDDPRMDQMPLPAETVAVMRRYARDPPSPSILFEDPHRQIAGSRIFSRWVAGQMIDSALYRGIAACDRLAIMLHCRTGEPLPRNAKGELRTPSFRRDDLKPLGRYFASKPAWAKVRELAVHHFFAFVKEERNGFTHHRRRPSELYGEKAIVYGSLSDGPEELVPAMDTSTHYAIAPAFYNEVLLPAIEATRLALVDS
jgi:hypothetical protein